MPGSNLAVVNSVAIEYVWFCPVLPSANAWNVLLLKNWLKFTNVVNEAVVDNEPVFLTINSIAGPPIEPDSFNSKFKIPFNDDVTSNLYAKLSPITSLGSFWILYQGKFVPVFCGIFKYHQIHHYL